MTTRSANRVLLLNLIRAHEPVSRKGLADLSGLSGAAVSGIVQDLLIAGAVEEQGQESIARAGRRAVNLGLVPAFRCVLGVRLQKGFLRLALVDLRNRVLARESLSLDTSDPQQVAAAVAGRLTALTEAARVPMERVAAVSVASPGLVDSGSGVVKVSVNLGWSDVPLGAILEERLGRPVHVENTANVAALAQKLCGPGRDCANLVYLTLSVGISAGIIVDHRIYGGARGYAGEIGHMTMTPEGGPRCGCGKQGCLEAYCGLEAVVARARAASVAAGLPPPATFAEVAARVGVEDPALLPVVAETGRILGVALGNLVNFVHPELVVLGGELLQLGEPLLSAARVALEQTVLPALLHDVRLATSTLTEDPSLIGATALALEELFAQDLADSVSAEGGSRIVG